MPSPFPGMNPYLERSGVWEGFHFLYLARMFEALAEQVRPRYVVKVEERLFLHEPPARERLFFGQADVSVSDAGRSPVSGTAAVVAAPARARINPAIEQTRQRLLEIRDRDGMELITVIELLSPSNKRSGPDRELYLDKRLKLLRSPVHLVEIDLLRGGLRPPLDGLPHCDYCVTVSRAEERPEVGIWPLRLADPLPLIPVPLKAEDPDATLDLQALLHRTYDAAGYADYIYAGLPEPPLHPADAEWARGLIAAAAG